MRKFLFVLVVSAFYAPLCQSADDQSHSSQRHFNSLVNKTFYKENCFKAEPISANNLIENGQRQDMPKLGESSDGEFQNKLYLACQKGAPVRWGAFDEICQGKQDCKKQCAKAHAQGFVQGIELKNVRASGIPDYSKKFEAKEKCTESRCSIPQSGPIAIACDGQTGTELKCCMMGYSSGLGEFYNLLMAANVEPHKTIYCNTDIERGKIFGAGLCKNQKPMTEDQKILERWELNDRVDKSNDTCGHWGHVFYRNCFHYGIEKALHDCTNFRADKIEAFVKDGAGKCDNSEKPDHPLEEATPEAKNKSIDSK